MIFLRVLQAMGILNLMMEVTIPPMQRSSPRMTMDKPIFTWTELPLTQSASQNTSRAAVSVAMMVKNPRAEWRYCLQVHLWRRYLFVYTWMTEIKHQQVHMMTPWLA